MTPAAELIEHIVHGDKQAEKHLVDSYYQGLFFILYRQTNERSLAEDLTQDSFIIVLNKLRNGELRNPDALSSFIRQVGINTLIAYRRQQSRRQTDLTDQTDLFEDVQHTLMHALQQQDVKALVRDILNALPTERDREILTRVYLYDEDKSTLCKTFDISPAHFDRVLFRARQRLRALAEEKGISSATSYQVLASMILLSTMYSAADDTLTDCVCMDKLSPQVRELFNRSHNTVQSDTFNDNVLMVKKRDYV